MFYRVQDLSRHLILKDKSRWSLASPQVGRQESGITSESQENAGGLGALGEYVAPVSTVTTWAIWGP